MALYAQAPSGNQLDSWGLGGLMTVVEQEVEVWPENWSAFSLFGALSTQWRVGNSGAYGLDYNTVPAVSELIGIDKDELPYAFNGLRIMESTALQIMEADRKKKEK